MSASLSQKARDRYYSMLDDMAETYGVESVTREFNVEPAVAQTLQDKITEKSDFLQRINIVPVSQLKGDKVFIGVNGPVASRTDTTTKERDPRNVLDLDNNSYELFSTESDVALPFATIDAWANFPDFADRYTAAVQRRMALDRILVGIHGTHAAKQTDRAAFPMLQDVNKGWYQIAKERVPEQILTVAEGETKVTLGKGGDYENLDAAVHDVKQMIDPIYRDEGDLVAIIGSDLLAADKGRLYAAQGQTPTEKERIELAQVIETYGGLPSFTIPYFNPKAIWVTSFANLSIYFQETSWRRHLLENPRRSRVEDFNARNEGYVLEVEEKFAALDGNSLELV